MTKPQLERETRFELATFCLGSRHSTTELLPHISLDCMIKSGENASVHANEHTGASSQAAGTL